MWLVGQFEKETSDGNIWFYAGIFSTKEKAIAACKNNNYFIGIIPNIDEELPEERSIFPKVEYPIKTCHKD